MNVRPRSVAAILLGIVLIVYYGVLVLVANSGATANRRHLVLLELGNQTSSRIGNLVTSGEALTMTADGGAAEATWDYYAYQIGRLARAASACDMRVAIVGLHLTSASPAGSADILVNGSVLKRITFSNAKRGMYPFAPTRLVPDNVLPEPIELVPLDREYGFLIPVPRSYCTARTITIGVRLHDASWTIDHAGTILDYTPSPIATFGRGALAALGVVALTLLVLSLFVTLRRVSTLGAEALVVATTLLALAPLAYDQWDFRLWLGFAEFGVFTGGDPAYLWYGSPLWTFVPSLFGSITAASLALTGHGSQTMTAILMKIGMGLAYCYTATEVARRAPARLRPLFAIMALLLPVGLFELAGGYRQLFAGALAIYALRSAVRGRLIVSTIVTVIAASISEELLPMTLLPATLALARADETTSRRLAIAGGLAAGAIALFLGEWGALVPHDFAASALGYRFGPAPLGGASWGGALEALGLLPAWLPVASPIFDAVLFLGLAISPALVAFNAVRRRKRVSAGTTFDTIAGVYVAFVAAFLIAFRGTDPNLWYSFACIAFWYLAAADPLRPFVFLLGTIQGLAFYVTVGFRDYVNQAFFWPVDKGVLGVLSATRGVFDLMATALMLAFIVAVSRTNFVMLFSSRTAYFAILFFAAVAATATAVYTLDIVICLAVVASVLRALVRPIATDRRYRSAHRSPRVQVVTVAALAGLGALSAAHNPMASVCATATCIIAARERLGACDVVLGAGAIAVVAVQPGSGLVSVVGWIAVTVTLLAILIDVVTLRSYSTQA